MTLDCTNLTDARALHRALAETLNFPDWYGHNLDALFDCLTELGETELTVIGLPHWAHGFRATLEDAMAENPLLHIHIL